MYFFCRSVCSRKLYTGFQWLVKVIFVAGVDSYGLPPNLLSDAEGGHISNPPSCSEQTTKEQQLVSSS